MCALPIYMHLDKGLCQMRVLLLTAVKFVVLSLYFKDLRKAHPMWIVFMVLLVLFIVSGMLVFF
jgi:hypothetical protein